MLIKALDEFRKTRSREKRDLYARVLRGAIVDFEQKEYSAEEYLYLVSGLTPQELRVARSLYLVQPKLRDESWEAWIVEVCDELDINKDDLPMMLNRIQSSGLIESVVVGTDEGGMWVFIDGVPYRVTSSFKRMMKFLGY